MQFYKKVLLTLSSAGVMASCAPLSTLTQPAQGTVVEKNECGVLLDVDNDGLADASMDINGNTGMHNQCYFHDYINVGDTLKYRTTENNPVILSADFYRNAVLDSVNNRSVADLKRIYDINTIRIACEKEKAR